MAIFALVIPVSYRWRRRPNELAFSRGTLLNSFERRSASEAGARGAQTDRRLAGNPSRVHSGVRLLCRRGRSRPMNPLGAAEVTLSGLRRDMGQPKLNLLQFSARGTTEASVSPPARRGFMRTLTDGRSTPAALATWRLARREIPSAETRAQALLRRREYKGARGGAWEWRSTGPE